jgi:hypothetical protein
LLVLGPPRLSNSRIWCPLPSTLSSTFLLQTADIIRLFVTFCFSMQVLALLVSSVVAYAFQEQTYTPPTTTSGNAVNNSNAGSFWNNNQNQNDWNANQNQNQNNWNNGNQNNWNNQNRNRWSYTSTSSTFTFTPSPVPSNPTSDASAIAASFWADAVMAVALAL